jgi:hypothetical protein
MGAQPDIKKTWDLLVALRHAVTKEQKISRIQGELIRWIIEYYDAFLLPKLGGGTGSPSAKKVSFSKGGNIILSLGSETLASEIKAFLERYRCTVEADGLSGTRIKLASVPGIPLIEIIKKGSSESMVHGSPIKVPDQWLETLKQMLIAHSETDDVKAVLKSAMEALYQQSSKPASVKIHASKAKAGVFLIDCQQENTANTICAELKKRGCTVQIETKGGYAKKGIVVTAIPGVDLKQIFKVAGTESQAAVSAPARVSQTTETSPRVNMSTPVVLGQAKSFSALSVIQSTSPVQQPMLVVPSEVANVKELLKSEVEALYQQASSKSASVTIHASKAKADVFLIACGQEDVAKTICAELKQRGCTVRVKTTGEYANIGVVVTGISGLDLEQIFKTTRSESPTSVSSQASKRSQDTLASDGSCAVKPASIGNMAVAPLQNTAGQQVVASPQLPVQLPKENKPSPTTQPQKVDGIFDKAKTKDDVLTAISQRIMDKGLDQAVDKEFNVLGFKIHGKSKSGGISEILKIINSSNSTDTKFDEVKRLLSIKDSEQGHSWLEKHSAPVSRGVGLAGFFKPTRARDVANFYFAVADAIERWSPNPLALASPNRPQ